MEPRRNPRGDPGAASAAGGRQAPAGQGAQAQAKQAAVTEAVDRLAADVQQLRVDFERFFSGALPFPPEDLRGRVQTQLRTLRNQSAGTAVDRFRLGDLEARFNSYNELFNRRVRLREEGRRQTPHAAAEAQKGTPRYDPQAGVVIGLTADPAAVTALYEGLAAAGSDGPRFDLASFDAYLQRQAAAIRAKAGCDDVLFRLAAEDGKLKLKARPVAGARNTRP